MERRSRLTFSFAGDKKNLNATEEEVDGCAVEKWDRRKSEVPVIDDSKTIWRLEMQVEAEKIIIIIIKK